MSDHSKHLGEFDWSEFLNEFQGESDRAAAVLGAANCDVRLEELLRSFFAYSDKKADEMLNGPVGSMMARTQLAVLLGLVTEDEYHDLNVMRKVRNAFAHELHGLSFESTSITGHCMSLRYPQILKRRSSRGEFLMTARSRYVTTAVVVAMNLEIRARRTKAEDRRTPMDPPTVIHMSATGRRNSEA